MKLCRRFIRPLSSSSSCLFPIMPIVTVTVYTIENSIEETKRYHHLYSPIMAVKDRKETINKDYFTKQIDYSHIT